MYSTLICFDWYWYSSKRSRYRCGLSCDRVEHVDRERALQAAEDLLRLIGQRELLGLGQVPALVLAVGDAS